MLWHHLYNQVFITSALLHPVGRCTLQSLCILINYLAINTTMRIRLCNRLTPWQFIKQIFGKAAMWNKQLIPHRSCGVLLLSADFDWGMKRPLAS